MEDRMKNKLHNLKMELYTYTSIVVERITENNYDSSFDFAVEKTKLINAQIETIEELMEDSE